MQSGSFYGQNIFSSWRRNNKGISCILYSIRDTGLTHSLSHSFAIESWWMCAPNKGQNYWIINECFEWAGRPSKQWIGKTLIDLSAHTHSHTHSLSHTHTHTDSHMTQRLTSKATRGSHKNRRNSGWDEMVMKTITGCPRCHWLCLCLWAALRPLHLSPPPLCLLLPAICVMSCPLRVCLAILGDQLAVASLSHKPCPDPAQALPLLCALPCHVSSGGIAIAMCCLANLVTSSNLDYLIDLPVCSELTLSSRPNGRCAYREKGRRFLYFHWILQQIWIT